MVGMIGMVAMLKVEATGIGRARPPHPCLACHRHQAPVLERTRRPAVLDAVRAAEVIAAVDPAKQVELPLIERIPSLHHLTVRATAYSMELTRLYMAAPVQKIDRSVGSA